MLHESRDASRMSPFARLNEFVKSIHWPTLLSGLAIGLATMQVLVGRNVTARVDRLAFDVSQVRRQVSSLAGSADDVARANDLLARLSAQREQLKTAGEALTEMRQLRTLVQQEADRVDNSVAVIEKMRKLNSAINSQAVQTDTAAHTVAAAVALQTRMAELGKNLPAQAADIAEAEAVLTDLTELKSNVLSQQADLAAAREQLDGLGILAKGLIAGAEQMIQARTAASELVAMKQMLMLEADGVERSTHMADQLIALNDKLADSKQIRIDEAQNNLATMLQTQQKLANQTRNIAESAENLDLLADFQTVLNEQLGKLDGIRRQLTDLVLMESTVARASRALAPLVEIGNMRNLGEQEMREAARVILDRRMNNSTTARMAEGTEANVISVSSPDEVFAPASRPTPVPPLETME